jgi:hypothetical protein
MQNGMEFFSASSAPPLSTRSAANGRRFATGSPGRRRSVWPPLSFFGGSSMDLAPDFNEFIASLNAHSVEFLIAGAYVLAFHGAPRLTG